MMIRPSVTLAGTFLTALLLTASPLLAQDPTISASAPDTATPAPAASAGVRIVRLSQVKGTVQLDRNTGHDLEPAFANLPITQGSRLKTGEGVAEVEFEDNSSLRLIPNSLVEFTTLSRDSAGNTLSVVNVKSGGIYVAMAPTKGSAFTVTTAESKYSLNPLSHIALQIAPPKTTLSVMTGVVAVQSGASNMTVGKKQSLVTDSSNSSQPVLESKLQNGPFDQWDKTESDYHQHYMNNASFGSGTPVYGLNDMNYYGSFNNLAGCGNLWQPYFASASWSPFANGAWAYYPNAGYSWVSPYPWGWTPYHSGSWQYCQGAGWGWSPGTAFYGLNNASYLISPSSGGAAGIKQPREPRGPIEPAESLILVNKAPLIASHQENDSFVFAKDSAGLGVPRESFGKLEKTSASTLKHGSTMASSYVAPLAASGHFAGANLYSVRAGINPGIAYPTGESHTGSEPGGRGATGFSSPSAAPSHAGGGMGGGAASGGSHH